MTYANPSKLSITLRDLNLPFRFTSYYKKNFKRLKMAFLYKQIRSQIMAKIAII